MINFKSFLEKKNDNGKAGLIRLILSLNDWVEVSEKLFLIEKKKGDDSNVWDEPKIAQKVQKLQKQKETANASRREKHYAEADKAKKTPVVQPEAPVDINIPDEDLETTTEPTAAPAVGKPVPPKEEPRELTKKELSAEEWYDMVLGKTSGERTSKSTGINNYRKTRSVLLGRIYAFRYDPKHKRILPYFDENPLVLTFDFKKGQLGEGFLGINLHYVPKRYRKYVLDFFMKNNIGQVMNQGKIDVDYEKIKHNVKYPWLKYCIRMYLLNHIVGNLYMVPQEDYIRVLDLYSAKFVGMSEQQIVNTLRNNQSEDRTASPRVEKSKQKREERNKKRRKTPTPKVKPAEKDFKVDVAPTYKSSKKQITGNV